MIYVPPDDPNELLRRINQEAIGVPIPPDFNPLAAGDDELDHYDLPRRPSREMQPELYAFWTELFSPPLTFVAPVLDYALPRVGNFQSAGAAAPRSRHEASLNWSGASITPRDGRMFTDVLGRWNVPAVAVPDGVPANGEYRSSTWIGLDGQRSYFESTLPQLGTAQHMNPSDGPPGPVASSWIQWWPVDPLTLTTLPVNIGDPVICWLAVRTQTKVRCIIKNQSMAGPATRMYLLSPIFHVPPDAVLSIDLANEDGVVEAGSLGDPPDGVSDIRPRVSGATADWVMERPRSLITDELYDLPKYSPVEFHDCYAISAQGPGGIGRLHTLVGPTLVDMYADVYDSDEDERRRVAISRAQRPGDHPHLSVVRTSYVEDT